MKNRTQLATRVNWEAGPPRAITRFRAFAVYLGLFAAAAAAAAEFDNRQVAQGVAIYLGVLPAQVARDQPPAASGGEMHRGTPEWGEQYHVVVALFEEGSGMRITDADVRATVFDARRPGNRLAGPRKQLEPMLVAGRASYGNYFKCRYLRHTGSNWKSGARASRKPRRRLLNISTPSCPQNRAGDAI